MNRHDIINQYHFWLTSLVCDEHHQRNYQALLDTLDEREFFWTVANDMNRAADGVDLRARFAEEHNINYLKIKNILNRPCSVLEMMVGLACRCEDSIMGDEEYGDRTPDWFWGMVSNMGLYQMDDERYDEDDVQCAITILLDRTYKRDGSGGLFCVPGSKRDLRKVEIWYQMMGYLDTLDN